MNVTKISTMLKISFVGLVFAACGKSKMVGDHDAVKTGVGYHQSDDAEVEGSVISVQNEEEIIENAQNENNQQVAVVPTENNDESNNTPAPVVEEVDSGKSEDTANATKATTISIRSGTEIYVNTTSLLLTTDEAIAATANKTLFEELKSSLPGDAKKINELNPGNVSAIMKLVVGICDSYTQNNAALARDFPAFDFNRTPDQLQSADLDQFCSVFTGKFWGEKMDANVSMTECMGLATDLKASVPQRNAAGTKAIAAAVCAHSASSLPALILN